MGIMSQGNILILAGKMLDRKKRIEPFIDTAPQKPPFGGSVPIDQPFGRATPESVGVESDLLADFLNTLKRSSSLDLHNIMIARKEKIICEAPFGAYRSDIWHITHSECKSITSLAVGMLVDEKWISLDDKLVKIFSDSVPALSHLPYRNLTVRHLLTMTSGAVFNEAGSITEKDWVRSFFEFGLKSEPGKKFNYNSMNSYMLSAIVKKVTGKSLTEYLTPRLFEPLGITKYFWETCPMGIEKGGWGMYMLPEDMMKIASLILAGGVWRGRRLISKSYIEEATSLKIETPDNIGAYGYGYHIWVDSGAQKFLLNGMFGQNVIGYKKTGLLLLENAGNDEIFQQSGFFDIADEFFGSERTFSDTLPENRRARGRMLAVIEDLKRTSEYSKLRFYERFGAKRRIRAQMAALDGKRYVPAEETGTVGLLPLFVQVIQNNYTHGLKDLEFNISAGKFYLTVNEEDESYVLPVGFFSPEYTDLTFHGEPYRVAVQGEFCKTEDAVPVFKVRVSFLEISSARTIKIFFLGDKTTATFSENPSSEFFDVTLGTVMNAVKSNPITDALISHADTDIVITKIKSAIEPTFTLVCEEQ